MKNVFLFILSLICVQLHAEGRQVFIRNGETVINTRVFGDSLKETVILLHGGPGAPYEMEMVVNELQKNYQVIFFEQRGSGQSICEDNDYSMLAYVSDINAIADSFRLSEFHLFGHSWGGLYAQIYHAKHPERIKTLFLCSPGSGTGEVWKQCEKEVLAYNRLKATSGEWYKMGMNSIGGVLGSDRSHQKLFERVMWNYNKGFVSNTVDFRLKSIRSKPINKTRKYIAEYPPLTVNADNCPVLITYGDSDIYKESKQSVYDRYPNASFRVIGNTGHIPWLHDPEVFFDILKRFYAIL